MSVSERLNRLLLMVPFLARESGASVHELCREFKISREVLMRDLDTLQMCGIPDYGPYELMDYSIEGDRVRVMMADYFRRPLNLTRQEALALFVSGSALIRSGVFEEEGPLNSALEKIEGLLSCESRGQLDDVVERIDVEVRAYESAMRDIIDKGLKRGKNLDLLYWTYSRDEMTGREVEPLSLIFSRGYWYLLGWCHVCEEERLFRLDRIASVALTDNDVSRRALEPYEVPSLIGEYKPGRKAHSVKLQFAGRQGRRIAEEWPATRVTERADGSVVVELRTRNLDWVANYILKFGAAVKVESPRELERLLDRKARAVLDAYGWTSAEADSWR